MFRERYDATEAVSHSGAFVVTMVSAGLTGAVVRRFGCLGLGLKVFRGRGR